MKNRLDVTHIKAFAPGNISLIFAVCKHRNPRWTGSIGVGFTINEGVMVDVSKSNKNEVFFNGKHIKFMTVMTVIKQLTSEPIHVRIISKLPLGYGFGLSGASALATAYAINKLLNLKKTKKELAILAHTQEVKNKTGLGDVTNQYFGGFFLKTKPSSFFKVIKLPLSGKYAYCRNFSSLSTKSILTSSRKIVKINLSGKKAVKKISNLKKPIIFYQVLDIAKEFVVESKLLQDKKTKEAVERCRNKNNHASMIILGNGVVSDKPFFGSQKFIISDKKAEVLS